MPMRKMTMAAPRPEYWRILRRNLETAYYNYTRIVIVYATSYFVLQQQLCSLYEAAICLFQAAIFVGTVMVGESSGTDRLHRLESEQDGWRTSEVSRRGGSLANLRISTISSLSNGNDCQHGGGRLLRRARRSLKALDWPFDARSTQQTIHATV